MPMDDAWNCSGSITFHSELTKEDWDMLADLEMENTPGITFITPQGRQVRYVKCDILDKIRAEIEHMIPCSKEALSMKLGALEIIDKYKDDWSSEGE